MTQNLPRQSPICFVRVLKLRQKRIPAFAALPVILGAATLWTVLLSRDGHFLERSTLDAGLTPNSGTAVTNEAISSQHPPDLLGVGETIPEFEAQGWLNGLPPEFTSTTSKLILVDIWAHWCPVCQQTAPALLKLYRKYKKLGVDFVSLTNRPKEDVQRFLDVCSIPWSAGFSIPNPVIASLGAFNPAMDFHPDYTAFSPGYEVAPTIYLVDANGKIRWGDCHLRLRHPSTADFLKELDAAIARTLVEVSVEASSDATLSN